MGKYTFSEENQELQKAEKKNRNKKTETRSEAQGLRIDCYYAFVESRPLNEIIKTKKYIHSDLSNIDILDDDEFICMMKHYLSYIYASNLALIETGLCYLKMIYEKSPERFEQSVDSLTESGYISITDDEEYDMTSQLLIFCDIKIYKRYLEFAKHSSDDYIRHNSETDLTSNCISLREDQWYFILCEEYSEFKRKLGL